MTFDITKETELFDFDHVSHENPSLIVYTKLGTLEFHETYKNLKSSGISFILRHFDPIATQEFVADEYEEKNNLIGLQGYGVELQLKNMEYNAMDQKSNAIPQESTGNESEEEDTDIEGLNFKILHEKYAKYSSELFSLKNSLLQQKTDMIDAWELKEIGIQASQKVIQGATPFVTLEYISQNLPSLMQSLTRLKVNESIKSEIAHNQQFFQAGSNLLVFNGKMIDVEKFTPFSLLDTIRYEISIKNRLESLGVPKNEVSKLLSLPQQFDTNQRFELLDKTAVAWINDLEVEDMYARMSSRLEDILQAGWYGPTWVRYNLFNNILVCDPSTKECLDTVRDIWGMWRQGYPIRFGFAFASTAKSTDSTVSIGLSGEQVVVPSVSLGIKVAAIFNYIKEKRDVKEAIFWLVRCNHGVKTSKVISEDVIRGEFAHAPQDLPYDVVLQTYQAKALSISSHITEKGFDTLPFILFNGKMKSDITPNAINQELNQEYGIISALVRSNVLKHGQNHLEVISNHFDSSPFYHQGIFGTQQYHEISPIKLQWKQSNDNIKSVSHILCLKKDQESQKTLENVEKYLEESSVGRVAVLHHNQDEFCSIFGTKDSFVITNGKLVTFQKSLQVRDLLSLEKMEKMRTSRIVAELSSYGNPSSDLNLYVSSLLGKDLILKGKRNVLHMEQLSKEFSVVKSNNVPDALQVIAIINPLSPVAQKISSVLQVFSSHFQFNILMFLNPMLSVGEAPLKNWYRYVLKSELEFENGNLVPPTALFKQIPPNVVLTLNMDVQETWLVGLTYSIFDLDNIKVSEIPTTLQARFQLDSIILSGSCHNVNTGKPPRGLQIVDQVSKEDTLVMANFGYFQIKASPNIVHLAIAEGRHSDIYEMVDIAITRFEDQKIEKYNKILTNYTTIPMTSFDGPYLFLRVKKRQGKGKEPLLAVPEQDGIMSSLSNYFSSPTKDTNETVHIFSVASGHMYERLLKIMILSVIKHTKAPVKFWFLKNYLSPQFKEYLPLMAQKYGFEYGLVMYKWPTWLHKQTVKMRTIWAYKVLFLDVLFPLKVNKIIFVDADQICRTDMSELMKMNLNGAVIGMTPFCSDKSEMDGYRFWKGGYWESHLRGRPYHISALYVVDIVKLRRDYAGDQYRMLYDSLSKDPNSLSNLDQDLPNYAQHQIPIFSLPQEWLWCESWCSDSSKGRAKTIDLCNNPQTKENKLDSARRIVPEWSGYDDEQNLFGIQLKKENKIHD